MKVQNGIIIDGVLHELKGKKRSNCLKCSLFDLCKEFKYSAVCWINKAYISNETNVEFRCLGKVIDIKIEKEEIK